MFQIVQYTAFWDHFLSVDGYHSHQLASLSIAHLRFSLALPLYFKIMHISFCTNIQCLYV